MAFGQYSAGAIESMAMLLGNWRLIAVVTLVAMSLGAAQPQPRIPVLAELFTSEGCNSCPPADELLEYLLQEQPIDGVYVVPLSEHVTYWDHQGWKDPFSSQQFTTRQQQYGLRFNLDSIYTPQLVIDGDREFVGSDRRSIERALREAAKKPKPELKVNLTSAGTSLTIATSGAGLSVDPDAELWLAVTEDRLRVDVKRGENANRTMKHSGVVRVLRSAGGVSKPRRSPSRSIPAGGERTCESWRSSSRARIAACSASAIQSFRNAPIGSTRDARRAGIRLASTDITTRIAAAAASVRPVLSETPNNNPPNDRASHHAATAPAAIAISETESPSDTTADNSRRGSAPRAERIPISRVRVATAAARTP